MSRFLRTEKRAAADRPTAGRSTTIPERSSGAAFGAGTALGDVRMNTFTRSIVKGTVLALKLLAFAAILKPVLVRHASKVVTVFTQPVVGDAGAHAPRTYTYFTGFHVLDFSDIKWALLVGVALYLTALGIQFAAASRPGPVRTPERRPAA